MECLPPNFYFTLLTGAISPNVWRYVLPPQHRGGACFCPRVGVLNCSFRYKAVGVCKNRDTIAGWPVPPLQICRFGRDLFAAQKAVAYTALLCLVVYSLLLILKVITSE